LNASADRISRVYMIEGIPDTVADLMTRKVVTVSEQDSLARAQRGMDQFHFRHLPVVSEGKLIGLVSRSDLLHASSSFLSDKAAERDQVIHELPVEKIMQHDVVTVAPGDSLVDAARLMWQGRLGCLPVVEEDDKLLGIITPADFLKLFVRLLDKTPPPPPSSIPPGYRSRD
jgi:CBS domain-containing protein